MSDAMIGFLILYFGHYGALLNTLMIGIVWNHFKYSPFCIYQPIICYIRTNTNMNWFGCLVCTIFLILIFPTWSVISDVLKLIYWLFHIGRKEQKV